MAAGGGRRLAATLQALIFVWLLGAASGLQILDDPPSMYAEELWYYRPGSVVAIDLGNTNSCVAGYAPGKTGLRRTPFQFYAPGKTGLSQTPFQFCIPSWVAFTDDGTVLVGEAARNHAGAHPEDAIFGFKRLLGLRQKRIYEDDIVQTAMKRAPYKITARDFDTPDVHVKSKDGTLKQLDLAKVASMVIAQLKAKAEEYLGGPVDYAVMTIPEHYRGLSIDSAMIAGMSAKLRVVEMVSEPISVAVAYGLRTKLREGGNALVLHVGGGTAEASVITLINRSLDIRASQDEPFLGGDDFDQKVMDYFVELVKVKHGKDIGGDQIALGKLRTACERAKKALSSQEHVEVTIESLFDGVDFSETLSRSKFEELNDETFRRVVALVKRVMLEAEERRSNIKIDEIILVGGSTMIPKIQRLVKEYFNGMEPNIRVKPDEAVALGAVVHAYSVY